MTVNDVSADFSDLIPLAISNPWISGSLIATIFLFLLGLTLSSLGADRAVVGLIFLPFIASGALAVGHLVQDSEVHQAQNVEIWVSDTYGINTELDEDKVTSLLASGHTDRISINDNGRILNLVVTGDDHLVVVDDGGEEVKHTADKK